LRTGRYPSIASASTVIQDSHYLTCFARVQALGAARAPDLATAHRFAVHIQATCQAEAALHETFLSALGVSEAERRGTPVAPTCYAYTSHLIRVAYEGTLGEIVAALLPCYWLYREVGERFRDASPPVELYRRWLEAYRSPWFDELVREQIERLDRLAGAAPGAERERMARHFLTSTRYEWLFWEMAYRGETWPDGQGREGAEA